MGRERKIFVILLSITGAIGFMVFVDFVPYSVENLLLDLPDWSKSANGSRKGLSILGEWLKAPEGTSAPVTYRKDKSFPLLILIWRYGLFLERRHIRRFTVNYSFSPWQNCSVQNCELSYRDEDLSKADAVVFHLHMTKSVEELPLKKGKPGQIWIFMTDESPLHTFLYEGGNQDISDYDNVFDWSMTYRTDSDIPVAYGRTLKRQTILPQKINEIGNIGKKNLVAIMGSNCSSKNRRWEYVKELKKLLGKDLDIYGRCLGGNTTACPGHFDRDCALLSTYKFYLAFENSNCREYLTEKVYWNAYEKKAVPIVMGAPIRDYQKLLPPRSFIHVDEFTGPADLVRYLIHLNENDIAYREYHEWRSSYVVLNEHGYFGSVSKHYCRVCEALRYNNRPTNRYRRIGDFWNSSRDCDNFSV